MNVFSLVCYSCKTANTFRVFCLHIYMLQLKLKYYIYTTMRGGMVKTVTNGKRPYKRVLIMSGIFVAVLVLLLWWIQTMWCQMCTHNCSSTHCASSSMKIHHSLLNIGRMWAANNTKAHIILVIRSNCYNYVDWCVCMWILALYSSLGVWAYQIEAAFI